MSEVSPEIVRDGGPFPPLNGPGTTVTYRDLISPYGGPRKNAGNAQVKRGTLPLKYLAGISLDTINCTILIEMDDVRS